MSAAKHTPGPVTIRMRCAGCNDFPRAAVFEQDIDEWWCRNCGHREPLVAARTTGPWVVHSYLGLGARTFYVVVRDTNVGWEKLNGEKGEPLRFTSKADALAAIAKATGEAK